MIPIFDLDDTLYDEISYVKSGFKAVAYDLKVNLNWSLEESFEFMLSVLNKEGRGSVFDRLLAHNGISNKKLVNHCVKIYRHHYPDIRLSADTESFLKRNARSRKIYLVTDGHKIVQDLKIKALKLDSFFEKIYITHRYGIRHAKPSIYCFQLIKKREACDWKQMFYVGDNPFKDFVNLNPLGVSTIRIRSGAYSEVDVRKEFDAGFSICSLDELDEIEKVLIK